jgi:single-stranded-DNA-specific exonuclease
VDAELPLSRIRPELLEETAVLSPFGEGNPSPVFLARGVEIADARVVGDHHLKLRVRDRRRTLEAIGFGMGSHCSRLSRKADLLFTPEFNDWQGCRRLQLRLTDIRCNGEGVRLIREDPNP